MFNYQIEMGQSATLLKVEPGLLAKAGGLLQEIPDTGGIPIAIVTDQTVAELYLKPLHDSLTDAGFAATAFQIPPGEASKSLAVAEKLYGQLADQEFPRDGVLIALGGGVVSDLAGFVAATWMRGVRLVIFPTTLEAMIDAAIGGKNGVNLPSGKNMVGTFHQPALVAIDPNCLQTLDARDMRAGLAESVKHALIRSRVLFDWHEAQIEKILALDEDTLSELIRENVQIKGDIVAQDTRESGALRLLLNFGHTIGHAIESCCQYTLRHGECVALGMVAACRLSHQLGLLDETVVTRTITLLSRIGLPVVLPTPLDTDRIMDLMRRDKKIKDGAVRLILLEGIGRPVIRSGVPEAEIRQAYESLLTLP